MKKKTRIIQPFSRASSGIGAPLPPPPVGVGFKCSQYSDTDMYKATARPTADAAHVELWNMTQVATHSPKYVRYRVKVT